MILTAGASLQIVVLRGNVVKQIRETRGFSVEKLANDSDITPHEYLEEIEGHVAVEVSYMAACRLARTLGVGMQTICALESYLEEVPKDPHVIQIEGIH